MKLSTGIHNKTHVQVQFIRKSAAVTNVEICIFLYPRDDISPCQFITPFYGQIKLKAKHKYNGLIVSLIVTSHERITNSSFLTSIFFLIYINDILFFLGK